MKRLIDIHSRTVTSDAAGGESSTYTAAYTDVACTIQPATPQEIFTFGTRDMKITHLIYTRKALSIKTNDKVVYGSRTFRVTGFRNVAERGTLYEIACYEFKGE